MAYYKFVDNQTDQRPGAVTITIFVGLICLLFMELIGFYLTGDPWTTSLVELAGVMLGSLFGLLASPKDEGEKKVFSAAVQAVSAFISGYVLSKIEPLINAALTVSLVTTSPSNIRVTIFLIAVIIGFALTYFFRAYFQFKSTKSVHPVLMWIGIFIGGVIFGIILTFSYRSYSHSKPITLNIIPAPGGPAATPSPAATQSGK
jgi:hypothetical protein